jgi:hypothetical protein
MSDTPHPAFEAAAPGQRWTGSKGELWRALRGRAYRSGGAPAWYILDSGLLVECRVLDPGRKEVRLWWPADSGKESRFLAACEQFLTHCQVVGQWTLTNQGRGPAPDERPDVLFAEYQESFALHKLEVRCEDCGAIILRVPGAIRQLCGQCTEKAAGRPPQEELTL